MKFDIMGKIIIRRRFEEKDEGGRGVADQENKGIGEVKIAADVVASIAALAATEVAGVYAMAGNVTNE